MENQTMTTSKLPIPPRRNVVPIAYAGKEPPKVNPVLGIGPNAIDVAVAKNGTHSNVADPVRLPLGTTIDGIDCSGMIDDPKKAGVPAYLQVQNRKGLTPEQLAKVKAIQTAARADEKAKLRERAEMAKQLGMA